MSQQTMKKEETTEVSATRVRGLADRVALKTKITTKLIGKEEAFRILAVAKAAGIPILLIGPPGTSKTASVLEFANAQFATFEETLENTYILETDEGTRTSEIKGTLNVKALVMENDYQLNTPAADAKFVIINEVDKASSGLRNAMLGIMNEKVLFNGGAKVPCQWEVFVATANVIPKEEEGNPFWDRFMIKYKMDRVTADQMMTYYRNGDKDYKSEYVVNAPTEQEIKTITIPEHKLQAFIGHTREKLTDRTLSFVPRMAKIVSLVYNVNVDKALVKVCELMTGNAVLAKELNKKLSSPQKAAVTDKVDMLPGIRDNRQLEAAITEIETMVNNFINQGKLSEDEVQEISELIQDVMSRHAVASLENIQYQSNS